VRVQLWRPGEGPRGVFPEYIDHLGVDAIATFQVEGLDNSFGRAAVSATGV
jgi:hypothetical protein